MDFPFSSHLFIAIRLNDITVHEEIYDVLNSFCHFAQVYCSEITDFRWKQRERLIKSKHRSSRHGSVVNEPKQYPWRHGIDPWPRSVGWESSAAVSCGVDPRRSSDLSWLWLWCRPMTTAPIRPLAWEPPYASGVALRKNHQKSKHKEKMQQHHLS